MNKSGINFVKENPENNPHCPHGPTLLFSREIKGKKKHFYACAACRDRKDCSFFLWQDNRDKYKYHIWKQKEVRFLNGINHRRIFLMLSLVKNSGPLQRIYDPICKQFIAEKAVELHKDHNLIQGISDTQLENPSEWLSPLDNSKKEAQYLFSKKSVEDIVDNFKMLGYKSVICIGAPRLYEYIRNTCPDISCILLDIDKRFHSFFGPLEFCWYNLFNNHFFLEEAKRRFCDFLRSNNGKDTVLVTDPPFGGRTEPIVLTLNSINELYKTLNKVNNDLPMFWIFPYFMEPQILNHLPNFQMLDYKVEYENHSSFQAGPKGRKQGSPVRIFTNVDPRLITLPPEDYKYCSICEKWVANENKHCIDCNNCTSKSGVTYVHCSVCQRCVKPTWKHCEVCNRCALIEHKCDSSFMQNFTKECFNCKEVGHKKSDCPLIDEKIGEKRKKTLVKLKDKRRK